MESHKKFTCWQWLAENRTGDGGTGGRGDEGTGAGSRVIMTLKKVEVGTCFFLLLSPLSRWREIGYDERGDCSSISFSSFLGGWRMFGCVYVCVWARHTLQKRESHCCHCHLHFWTEVLNPLFCDFERGECSSPLHLSLLSLLFLPFLYSFHNSFLFERVDHPALIPLPPLSFYSLYLLLYPFISFSSLLFISLLSLINSQVNNNIPSLANQLLLDRQSIITSQDLHPDLDINQQYH